MTALERFRVLVAHGPYLSGRVSGENSEVEDEVALLRSAGHEVVFWNPMATTGTLRADARLGSRAVWSHWATRELRRLLADKRIDVLHAHNLFPQLSPAILRVASGAGVPVVMTLHNFRLMCLPAGLFRDGRVCEDCVGRVPWRGVVRRCYRDSYLGSAAVCTSLLVHRTMRTFDRVDRFISVSRFVADKYVEAGLAPDRISIKPNFSPPGPVRAGPGRDFVYMGRLSPEKGLGTLLRAWGPRPERLLLVGDGPLRGSLGPLPDRAETLGPLQGGALRDVVASARAVIVPSVGYDAAPRVIAEAYSSGVPVIASRIGGIPELVIDGEDGILVEPGSVEGLSHAVDALSDDALSTRLGAGAHRAWQRLMSPDVCLARLTSIYRDVTSGRRVPPTPVAVRPAQ